MSSFYRLLSFPFAIAAFLVLVPGQSVLGCSAAQVKTEQQLLDLSQTVCAIGQSELPTSAAVSTACGIDAQLTPSVEQIINAHKAAMVRTVASASATHSAAPVLAMSAPTVPCVCPIASSSASSLASAPSAPSAAPTDKKKKR